MSVVTTNLCINPSFEVDDAGWTLDQVTFARTATNPASGSWAGEFTRVGVAGFRGIIHPSINLAAGTSLTASYTGRSPDSVPMSLFYFWKDAPDGGGGGTGSPDQTDVLTASNVRYEFTAIAPALTQSVIIAFYDQSGGVEGEKFVLDAIQFEVGTEATDYLDGSLTDTATTIYDWTGAAHGSTSTRTFTPPSGLTLPFLARARRRRR